jgi:hypothetical protein
MVSAAIPSPFRPPATVREREVLRASALLAADDPLIWHDEFVYEPFSLSQVN